MVTMKKRFLFLSVLITFMGCAERPIDANAYLKQVKGNLEQIKTASYTLESYNYLWGAKEPDGHTMSYFKSYIHPEDTMMGWSFVVLDPDNKRQMSFGYDGEASYEVFPEHEGVIRDDFSTRKLPFRPFIAPFYKDAHALLDYTLTTEDNVTYTLVDSVDYYKFHIIIKEDEQVELIGGQIVHNDAANPIITDPTSEYELWIDKQKDLPYRLKRIQEHNTSDSQCIDPVINAENPEDFDISDYIPYNYVVKPYTRASQSRSEKNALLNLPAPQWTLQTMDGKDVSLKDFHSKLILLEFSGVACGPCQAAVPFLKKLREDHAESDLQIISLESWGANDETMKAYQEKKQLNYPYVRATDQVIEAYKTGKAAPWFFLIDKTRFVRKVFYGFGLDYTDLEIKKAIDELL